MQTELVKIAEKHYEGKDNFCEFTNDTRLNIFLNEDPNAFVLGCIMDKQIPASRAWAIPYKIYKKLGNFDIDFLADISVEEYKRMFDEGKYHRFNNQCAEFFYEGVQKIKNDYDGDASNIWANNPSSKEVVKRFREFKGVGPAISNMAANIVARDFKIPMSDYRSIDVSPDIHVTTVMGRVFFNGKEDKDEIVKKAREINPEFPGLIDLACRFIGIDYCRPTDPECYHCPLNKECSYHK